MNIVTLIGRLTKDIDLKYLKDSGTPIAKFTIAIDREISNKGGKKETDYIDIQAWGKTAENCVNYLSKGSQVAVNGSIRIDKYKKDDVYKTSFKINANKVKFLNTTRSNVVQDEPSYNLEPMIDDDIPF